MTRLLAVIYWALVCAACFGALSQAAGAGSVGVGSIGSVRPASGFAYVSSSALTTQATNTRIGATGGDQRSADASWSSTSRIGRVLAAKAVRPSASDARLGRALGDDFRGGPNPIGDGSALDAARHTVRTGDLVGGSTHLEKVVEMRDRYARILRRGGHSSADEAVARSRYGAYRDFAREHDLDAMMRARGLR